MGVFIHVETEGQQLRFTSNAPSPAHCFQMLVGALATLAVKTGFVKPEDPNAPASEGTVPVVQGRVRPKGIDLKTRVPSIVVNKVG